MKIKNNKGETIDVKLPKAFKTKWVKALRSGKFIQGKHKLYSEINGTGSYCCCLVVACIVANVDKKDIMDNYFINDKFDNVPEILKGIGGDNVNVLLNKLTQMNDGKIFIIKNGYRTFRSKSFNYIASYIERYL